LGASILDALSAGGAVDPLARYFEYWLLRLQGVYPSIVACHGCGVALDCEGGGAWLAPGHQVFTCAACAPVGHGDLAPSLSRGALAFLRAAQRLAPRAAGELRMEPLVLAELERVHHMLMGRHLERELKSTRVLRDVRRSAHDRPARQAESRR
jgi:recombinational DNA repair protein (RecF pathway)